MTVIRHFLADEQGDTWEYLIRVLVVGLGGATILFGILGALRQQGGKIIDAIDSFNF